MGGVTPRVRLGRGRAKPIWAGHPRVLSGAVRDVEGEPGPGDEVRVVDSGDRPIGRGLYSPGGQVRVWMLTRDPEEEIDEAFFDRRIRRAVDLRVRLGFPSDDTSTYRLIHGDGDGLPGMVADRYGDYAVMQLTIRGMEDRRDVLSRLLCGAAGLRGVGTIGAAAIDAEEDLEGTGGPFEGDPLPEEIEVRESGITYFVDPVRGQKTGHFADHRESRCRFAAAVAAGRVLDAFCGTGGFALAAAKAGAESVTAADSSPEALERASRNAVANGVSERVEFVKGDVFRILRRFERDGERFDAVCIDPPRMASRKRELKGALRGYKELNLRAMRLISEGGTLATASCTGVLSEGDFLRMLRDAALDAKRRLTVLHFGGQGPDHPWSPTAPESRYLKFLLGRVD